MSKNTKIVCLVAIGAAGVLFVFFRDRFSASLPFLLILACPLLHLVFMGRMNHGEADKTGSQTSPSKPGDSKPSCH